MPEAETNEARLAATRAGAPVFLQLGTVVACGRAFAEAVDDADHRGAAVAPVIAEFRQHVEELLGRLQDWENLHRAADQSLGRAEPAPAETLLRRPGSLVLRVTQHPGDLGLPGTSQE